MRKIEIAIIKGVEGYCISLNNYRICGPKPWGGGQVIKSWYLDLSEIKKALK